MQIQYFTKGAALEPQKWQCSEVELHVQNKLFLAGVKGPLKDHRSFGGFNAQICILPHCRVSFPHQKMIYNSGGKCPSIQFYTLPATNYVDNKQIPPGF